MNKLVLRMATFVVAFAALLMISVPVFATSTTASPKIDYAKEQITALPVTWEYSFDKKVWNNVFADGSATTPIDISNKISLTAPVKIYYRQIGKTALTDIKELVIPKRPVAPVGLKFTPANSADPAIDLETINTTTAHEYKYGISVWNPSESKGVKVGALEVDGGNLTVRTKATTGAFASVEKAVAVPKQAAGPAAAKYDLAKDGLVVTSAMEYYVEPLEENGTPVSSVSSYKWKSVDAKQTFITRADIEKLLGTNKGKAANVYVRTKITAAKAASKIKKIYVPKTVAYTDVKDLYTTKILPTMNMGEEKIKVVTENLEYRVLNDKTVLTATHSLPVWKAVTGEELDFSKSISPAASKLPNTIIQIRAKAVRAEDETKKDAPASTPITFKMTKRAATPKITDVVVSYVATKEKITMPKTFEYKIGSQDDWLAASATTPTAGTVLIPADTIPATGSKPVVIQVRVKAITSATVSVPASLIFNQAKIAATPATPKAVLNIKAKKVTGVTAAMEYQMGTSTSWTSITGTFIELPAAGSADKEVAYKIRVKATAKAPVSGVQELSGTIPAIVK